MVYTGRVKWFNKNDGHGFIRNVDDPSQEIFVHHTELKVKSDCFRYLTEGEYVEYEVGLATNDKYTEQAKNITGIR